MPVIPMDRLFAFRETVADLPQSEREEKILEWWAQDLPNFDADFNRVCNEWCEKNGIIILVLAAADAVVPGYSIQGLRYRCLSHCRVLRNGKVVHDLNPRDAV